jgi:glycosyltransferase involved in cell wall biosynthesis
LSALRLQQARRYLESRGCERTVLYLWRPEPEVLRSRGDFDAAVYHIYDEYSFSTEDPPTSPEELEVLRGVDEVVIHSPTMMEKKGKENPNTLFLPNGVDFTLYDRAWPEPEGLSAIPHPRVGYTGFIKNQLDWELITNLVTGRPEISFVFVGPTREHEGLAGAVGRVEKLPNAHFLGMQPTHGLPAWVQHFDACIMPYSDDGYTRYIYPLKLHEYLATGRPVVATPLPNLRPFEGLISLARGPDEWIAAVDKALTPEEQADAKCEARKDEARIHDWEQLAGRLGEVLLARVHEGSRGTSREAGNPRGTDGGRVK